MTTAMTRIKGIGPGAAAVLAEHGFHSAEEIASLTPAQLSIVPGFGPVRSQQVIAEASALVATVGKEAGVADDPPVVAITPTGSSEKKKGKGKKQKDKGKGKGKGKGNDKGKGKKKDDKKKNKKKKNQKKKGKKGK